MFRARQQKFVSAIRNPIEQLERRSLLAAVSWDGGGDGTSWNDASNWSGNAVPGASDDVTLNVGANPNIVLTGTASTIQSLNSSENLKVFATTLTVTNGATLNAPMRVSGSSTFHVTNLTTNNVLSLGDVDDSYGVVQFNGPAQTINGTGSINGAGAGYAYIYNATYNTATSLGDALTIGSSIEINFGQYGRLSNSHGQGSIINNGQINSVGNSTTAADVAISNGTTKVINNGTMSFTSGARVILQNLTNNAARTITSTDSSLTISDDGAAGLSWDNNGTIVATNSQLTFGGHFVFADMGTVNRTGGEVNIAGILDNTGATLTLNNTTGSWNLSSYGRILNGTVTATGTNTLRARGGVMDNVILNMPLAVDASNTLYIENGITINNVLTLGNASDNSYGNLQFIGVGASINGTGSIDSAGTGYAYLSNNTYNGATGDTLTITPNIEINFGAYGRLQSAYGAGTILNNGQINVVGNGTTSSDVAIGNGTTRLTNNGTITITNAAKVLLFNVVNNAAHTISATNSELSISDDGAGGPYSWDNNGTLTANNSRVNLGGHFLFADIGTFNRTGGEVHLAGILDNTGQTFTLNNTTGSWFLSPYGRILNGTVTATGANKVIPNGGVMENVTLNTPVQIDEARFLYVQNGMTLNSVMTIGNATDNSYGAVQFIGEAQSLTGTGSVDSAGTNYAYFQNHSYASALGMGAALTIGASIELNFGAYVRITNGYGQASIINNGPLNLIGNGTTASDIQVSNGTTSYVNNSTVNITNGAISLFTNLVNNAGHTINVTDSQLTVVDDGQAGPLSWDNNGTIVYTNSHLKLGGYFVAADMGTLTRAGGELSFVGTLDNTSATFALNNTLGNVNLAAYGRILNGTVNGSNTLIGRGGTLDGVTLSAPAVVDQNSYLFVEHGLTLNSVMTLGAVNDSFGVLQFNGVAQTLGGTGSIEHLGAATTYIYNYTYDNGNGTTLTIGPGIEINTARTAQITTGYANGSIINNGVITIDGDDIPGLGASALGNTSTTFINNGTINAIRKAHVVLTNLQGNANTIGTADLDTWLFINGVYNINTLTNIASRSTMFFDGTWTRSASMNINGTAIFDHDADGGATFNAIKSAVISGYAGGAWNGNGLRDSVAASTPKYTLGYAASNVIVGATGGYYNNLFVDETAVIVHHTLDADFNMDNAVNFTDLLKLAQSYGLSNKNFTDGDVDFNSSVNFNDLLPVAQLYGQSAFSSTPITRMLDCESDRSIV